MVAMSSLVRLRAGEDTLAWGGRAVGDGVDGLGVQGEDVPAVFDETWATWSIELVSPDGHGHGPAAQHAKSRSVHS